MENSLIISDTQCPWVLEDAFPFLEAAANEISADVILHVGDEADLTSLARAFKPNPNAPGPGHEFELAKEQLDRLEAIFPVMNICHSNHGARIWKKAHDAGIPDQWIKNPKEAFNKPNWHWEPDWWIEWLGGPVCVTHGDRKKGAFNYAKTLGASVISGHQHSMFGIQYQNSRHSTIFGMDVGCLCNPDAVGLEYAKMHPLGQVYGCGAIVNGVPKLIPLMMNSKGKWDGKIRLC